MSEPVRIDSEVDPDCEVDPDSSFDSRPARPWLRRDTPILWRSADTVQVGEAERSVLIKDLPRDLLGWARSLQGDRTMHEALRDCPDASAGRRLIDALCAAGALDDAARAPRIAQRLTRAQRDRVQRHHAAARLIYSDDRAHLAVEARAAARVAIHGRGPLADAVQVALRHSGIGRVHRSSPPSSAARSGRAASTMTDLQVLAHTWHPDAFDDAGCLALDLPHLPLAAWGAHGVVGPLVVPGRTPCLGCGHLHARDRDPAFPTLQMQRAHARPEPPAVDTALILAVAALATVQIIGWLESLAGGETDPHRLHVRLPGGQIVREEFAAHPLCGCGWSSSASG